MKTTASPAMWIMLVLLAQAAPHNAARTPQSKPGQIFRSGLSLAQDADKKKDAKKNIPVVTHNKIKGNGYAEGSVLYDKQKAKAAITSGAPAPAAATSATAEAIDEGRDKVLIVFCIIFSIFLLMVYAMFQVQIRGKDVNPNFENAVQLTLRVAVFAWLLSCLVWFKSLHWITTDDFKGKIPLVICLYFFTVSPILGTTIQNAFAGGVGTLWAFLMIWFMNGVFPGGMAPGMSGASATAIFGWVSFFFFTWIILWSKCSIGMKMFALSNAFGGFLAFMNPESQVKFSEGFTIDPKGTAFNTLIATWIACAISPLVNLVPSVLTSAFLSLRGSSTSVSNTTAQLFEDVVEYYGGECASVRVEMHIKRAYGLRATIDGMGGTIAAAWWECFDAGKAGTVRALMESYQAKIGDIHDRLCAALVCASTEQFEPSHKDVMKSIMKDVRDVARLAGKLLRDTTEAAGDGVIDSSERENLKGQIDALKFAVQNLARGFDATRRSVGSLKINSELLGESFFVLTLSAYARIVWQYTEELITGPKQPQGFVADVSAGIRSTWTGLLEADNMFFLLKHFVALSFCWIYAIYIDKYSGACLITAVFLMNNLACPDVQGLLNAMNAVILAAVVGSLTFEWSCESQHSAYVLPVLTLVIWLAGTFGVFSKSRFSTAAIFIIALIPFKLIAKCPDGPFHASPAAAAGTYAGMIGFVLAIIFVALFQYLLAKDRASNLAMGSLKAAFQGLKDGNSALWVNGDMQTPLAAVAGNLSTGCACSASAAIEPRLWRIQWNHALYLDVASSLSVIRLDFLMMANALTSKNLDGQYLFPFKKFSASSSFSSVENKLGLIFTLTEMLCVNMLEHTGGVLSGLDDDRFRKTNLDKLDDLPKLISDLNSAGPGGLNFPAPVPSSMEFDELCQVSTVLLMLQLTTEHMAMLLKKPIKQI